MTADPELTWLCLDISQFPITVQWAAVPAEYWGPAETRRYGSEFGVGELAGICRAENQKEERGTKMVIRIL